MVIETVKEILAGATSAGITCKRVSEFNFLETAKMLVFLCTSARVEVLTKNNVRLAVNSGEKKLFSPQSARNF